MLDGFNAILYNAYMHILRLYTHQIIEKLKNTSKAVVIYGPRQAGKTTLAKDVTNALGLKTLYINADEKKYHDAFSARDLDKMRGVVEGYEMLVLDEAQRIPEIGINLKILIDGLPSLKILATGSSSFDLASKINEPLTGRIWTFTLYPVSLCELGGLYNRFELQNRLENFLIYGNYPEVLTTPGNNDKQQLLMAVTNSYLYKDVLELARVEHPGKIENLLKLLAYQIGGLVSINELSNSLGLSRPAVERYIHLLEKTFVIFRLKAFSRNPRKEISKMDKIFFYDVGVRNAIISDFKNLNDRNDLGQLWENFIIAERLKFMAFKNTPASLYFWRKHTGAEIDLVEEKGENFTGYEIKWKEKRLKLYEDFPGGGKNAVINLIHSQNFLDYLL